MPENTNSRKFCANTMVAISEGSNPPCALTTGNPFSVLIKREIMKVTEHTQIICT